MSVNRTIRGLLIAAASVLASLLPLEAVHAESPYVPPLITTVDNALVDFPNAVEFHLMYVGVTAPKHVDLEFSIAPVHSCDGGTVHSVRFPAKTTIIWRWEPGDERPIPPGHAVRWRWRVTAADGSVRLSHPREFVWTDQRFDWQSYAKDELTIHWHGQYPEFGEHLVGFLEPQIERIEAIETARLPVNVFIYENAEDAGPGALRRRDSVNPYRQYNTVVSVLTEEIEGEELTALIHELAHFVVQDRAFNCFGGLPQWLEEGLAIHAEGEPSSEMRLAFAQARLVEQFVPLRSFGAPFGSGDFEMLLRFAQSYYLVEFLIDEFGWESIGLLLDLFKDGITVDDALKTAIGIDIQETESQWRTHRGLPDLAPTRPPPSPANDDT